MVKGMIVISFQESRSLPRTRFFLQHIRAWACNILQSWRSLPLLCLSVYFCLGLKWLIDLLCFSDELFPTVLWPSFFSWTLFLHHPTLGFSAYPLKEHSSLWPSLLSQEKGKLEWEDGQNARPSWTTENKTVCVTERAGKKGFRILARTWITDLSVRNLRLYREPYLHLF